jgi:ABC-type spermidine/putrescine transport system permease subunit II
MVSIPSLWLPILLSAVAVFVASSIIHMVLGYHAADYKKLPAEDDFMAAVRKLDIPPGDYLVPCPGSAKAMKDPAFMEKFKAGPRAMMTVMPGGEMNMGPQFIQWFLYSVVVGVTAAYISGRALGPGAHYLKVFRFAGATSFFGYSLALWPMSIWYKKAWGTTLRGTLDGLIYGLLTAGFFGWLWPR